MDKQITKKLERIDMLANRDEKYIRMLRRGRILEKRFDAMIEALPMEQRNLAWDFVMLCEEMSDRKLKLACLYMDFKP